MAGRAYVNADTRSTVAAPGWPSPHPFVLFGEGEERDVRLRQYQGSVCRLVVSVAGGMSARGLGRVKTPVRSADVEASPKIPHDEAKRSYAESARYRIGELHFLHFADV
jgi:hypothetical protein